MLIILTGLSGSGKTATGKHLGSIISGNFIDLDTKIQSFTNKTIASLFDNLGEKNFRKIETFVLKSILLQPHDKLVLSLGGGAFINKENRDLCLKSGIVIWLNTSIPTINNRLKYDLDNRPLLKSQRNIFLSLSNLLEQRKQHYQQATHTINITDKRLKPLKIAHQIMDIIHNANK